MDHATAYAWFISADTLEVRQTNENVEFQSVGTVMFYSIL